MADTPIILAFVGMTGSGKDTCTDYVAQHYHVPVIHFGNIVYDEVHRRGLDIVQHEKAVREELRATGGKAVLAKHVAEKARTLLAEGNTRVVLNGLYSWSEYKHLSEVFGDSFICIALAATRTIRYERILNRKDAHRPYTIEQIKEREVAEIENLEKGGPIARADYTLVNDKEPTYIFAQLDALLEKITF
jgi:dephospho-CoA kinase